MNYLSKTTCLLSPISSIILILLLSAFIINCGGARSNNGKPTIAPSIQPTLQSEYGVTKITFNWDKDPLITNYQLISLSSGGATGVTDEILFSNLFTSSVTLPISVHLQNWATSQFKIRGCNSVGCIDSNIVDLRNQSSKVVGYIKAFSDLGDDDNFGYAVAISGDGNTMAVGAPNEDSVDITNPSDANSIDSGAVYIYQKINNSWQFKSFIKPTTISSGSQFGSALDLSDDGSVLVVGEWLGNSSVSSSGAAYIFELINSNWDQIKKLTPIVPQVNERFGFSIAISGNSNTIVVGAPGKHAFTPSKGKITVFTKVNSQWDSTGVVLAPTDSIDYDYFGNSVDINFDGTKLIAAKLSNPSFYFYDFKQLASATSKSWIEEIIIAPINNSSNFKGGAVSMDNSGNVIAVSQIGSQVHLYKNELNSSTNIKSWNKKYTYVSAAIGAPPFSGESFSSSVIPYIGVANNGYPTTLALSGNGKRFIVGAPYESTNQSGVFSSFSIANGINNLVFGASYLFEENASGQWIQKSYIKAANSGNNDFFGTSVAISNSGKTLAIGAIGESSDYFGISTIKPEIDNENKLNSGAVYLY